MIGDVDGEMRSKKSALFLIALLLVGMFMLTLNATPSVRADASKIVYVVNMQCAEMYGINGNGHEAYGYPSSPYYSDPHPPIDLRCYAISPASTVSQIMDSSFRDSLRDSFGTPFKMTFFAEMDYLFEQGVHVYGDGSPAGVSGYTAIRDILLENWGEQIETYGDAIEYHHHFMRYDGGWYAYDNGPDAGYGDYQMDAIDKMIFDGNFYPVCWDSGWGIMPPVLSAWLEQWMPFDYTSTSSTEVWYPIPFAANRWATRTDIWPSWEGINDAFATAESRGSALYTYSMHVREDMATAISSCHDWLVAADSAYPDVSFKYVTAADAMRLALGWTDFTEPTFTISPSGDSYIITASEPLFADHPYVALEYSDGTYTHMEAVNSGSNTWTITPQNPSSLVKIGVAASDPYGNPGCATYTCDEYSLTLNVLGDGSVSRNPDQPSYTSGTVVTLNATPAAGWNFTGWSGDLTGNTNPTTITMNTDKTVTATFTEIATTEQNVLLAVRGNNDMIYYRLYDTVLEDWSSWGSLPGSTVDAPAAAILDNQLHIVVRGMDGASLWHGYYDLTSESFSGWTNLEGSTPSSPVLTSNGSMLCLVVQGEDNLIYYRCYSEGAWGDWQVLPEGSTIDSPSAALLGDELHVVVRGMDGFSMWHKIIKPGGEVVQEWTWIPGVSASPPVLAASQSSGELYMLVRGADDGIYECLYDSSWGTWASLEGSTIASPAAMVCGDQLHVIVQGSDAVTLWYGAVDLDSMVFGGWNWISGSTPSKPVLTS
jgi:uncharacterized repeat protein (TIGR02543 family)